MLHDNIGTIKDLALHRLNVAKEDLDAAECSFKNGYLRAANNRAYYSIYCAVTVVLALEQKAFKSHKMTIAYFNKSYVKTEIFSRNIGKNISQAEEACHASDYDEFYLVSKTETEQQIEVAKEFLLQANEFIESK